MLLLANNNFWELSEITKLLVDLGIPVILQSWEPVRLQYIPTELSVKLANKNF
jgi:hypothetical protein